MENVRRKGFNGGDTPTRTMRRTPPPPPATRMMRTTEEDEWVGE